MSELGARAGAGQAPLRLSSTVLAQNVGQWTPCKVREDSAQLPPPGLWCMDQSPAPPPVQASRRSARGTAGQLQAPGALRGPRGAEDVGGKRSKEIKAREPDRCWVAEKSTAGAS